MWVYDNEPRSKEITSRIQSAIEAKQTVVIWPSNIQQKDINDMVLAGHDVQNLVESNTYRGLEATLKFTLGTNMSDSIKVKSVNGRGTEPLDLDRCIRW